MKTLMHIVPRAPDDDFLERMRDLASELSVRSLASGIQLKKFERLESDPFGRHTPFQFTLELRGGDFDTTLGVVAELGDRIDCFAHADLSTLLMGEDHVFVKPEAAPVRYQYLMRRNAEFTHVAYLDRYREIHSDFGLRTPGILGYTQFHVDIEASRRAASVARLGVFGVDSVSELHLESLEVFLAAVSKSDIGAEAIADEKRFVDRPRSMDFCSLVVE